MADAVGVVAVAALDDDNPRAVPTPGNYFIYGIHRPPKTGEIEALCRSQWNVRTPQRAWLSSSRRCRRR